MATRKPKASKVTRGSASDTDAEFLALFHMIGSAMAKAQKAQIEEAMSKLIADLRGS